MQIKGFVLHLARNTFGDRLSHEDQMVFACEGITRRNRTNARHTFPASYNRPKVKLISKRIFIILFIIDRNQALETTKRLKYRIYNSCLSRWLVDDKNKCNIMTDVNKFRSQSINLTPLVQHAEAILKRNKHIQNSRLQHRLPHVPASTNLCWQMPCTFISFVTVVHRQPLTDLHPHSPVFRSLLYPCWGSSLRGKQNICAGQAGAAGRSKSAEQREEGQNLPLRALFNQKEVTLSDLAKRILNPAPVQFPLPSSRRKPL